MDSSALVKLHSLAANQHLCLKAAIFVKPITILYIRIKLAAETIYSHSLDPLNAKEIEVTFMLSLIHI